MHSHLGDMEVVPVHPDNLRVELDPLTSDLLECHLFSGPDVTENPVNETGFGRLEPRLLPNRGEIRPVPEDPDLVIFMAFRLSDAARHPFFPADLRAKPA